MIRVWACLAILTLASGGCVALFPVAKQTIEVSTAPAGAQCTAWRSGDALVHFTAPATLTVEKSLQPLAIQCRAPGYDQGVIQLTPQAHAMPILDVLFARGTLYAYPATATITLSPSLPGHSVQEVRQHR
jgi:hypothetical protein